MKYIVMECHYSYAVVLSEDGRFLKVANMHYDVGQTIDEIVEMGEPETAPVTTKKTARRWITSIAAMAACMAIALTSVFHLNQSPYASVYMTINPAVRIDVNRKDSVVGLEGMNEDGIELIEDYTYKRKDLNLVMDELVDRAIDMGYLSDGDQISLTLDADNDEWVVSRGNELNTHLNEYLKDKMTVTIQIDDADDDKEDTNTTEEKKQTIVIPVDPDDSDYGTSDYGNSSSEKSTSKTPTTSDDSGYDADDNDSNYDTSNYDASDDSDSSYS